MILSEYNKLGSGFYGEWVPYDDEEDKEDAILYLKLWKKFILRKLIGLEQKGHDQIIIKPAYLGQPSTIGIKFEMKEIDEKKDE